MNIWHNIYCFWDWYSLMTLSSIFIFLSKSVRMETFLTFGQGMLRTSEPFIDVKVLPCSYLRHINLQNVKYWYIKSDIFSSCGMIAQTPRPKHTFFVAFATSPTGARTVKIIFPSSAVWLNSAVYRRGVVFPFDIITVR